MNIIESKLQFRSALSRRSKTDQIVLHHAAARTCSVEQIHSWHLGNGWSGIGYHFFVRKDGKIYRGRPIDMIGAHCTNHNSNTIGVCFEGNFQEETMNGEQLKAGQELISYLKAMYKLSDNSIVRHRDLMATSCPGNNFPYDQIKKGDIVGEVKTTTNVVNPIPKTTNTYTVVKGDTLSKIGGKFSMDWKKIAEINKISFPYTIRIGQVLKLDNTASVKVTGYNAKITAKSGLNMRKLPNTTAPIVVGIPKGTKIYISKVEGEWGYTSYDGKYGWVYLMYTKKC